MALFRLLNLPNPLQKRFSFAFYVLLFGIFTTVSCCALFLYKDRTDRELEFQRAAATHIDLIKYSLSQDMLLVRSLKAFFEANQNVQITDYQEFVTPLLKRYQGMEALQWAPHILKNNLAAFEKEANKYLFKYSVTDINSGLLKEADVRQDYFPVYYIAPANKGEKFLGFDLASDPKILEAIQRSVVTKDLVVSQRVILDPKKPSNAEVFIVAPVFVETGTSLYKDSNYPAGLNGIISGVLNIQEAIQLAISPSNNDKLDYVIYSGDSIKEESILVANISTKDNPSLKSVVEYFSTTTGFSRNAKISMGNTDWNILLIPAYHAYSFGINSLVVTCLILLCGMIFTGFTLRLLNDKKTILIQKTVLERKNELLEATNKHRSDFLATMSHELRTPLNSILGFADLLKKEPHVSSSKAPEYADIIVSSGEHLLSLINEVLDLSKVQAGKYELELSKFNPKKVIESAIQSFSGAAASRDIKLSSSGLERLVEFHGDERVFRQVLLNILSNSMKFIDDGGSISLTANQENQQLEISIKDTGIGIDPKDHAMIFEEFKQVNSSLSKDYGGTGLGLAIVKRFVELHGGWVKVESSLGNGATFTFLICELKNTETS